VNEVLAVDDLLEEMSIVIDKPCRLVSLCLIVHWRNQLFGDDNFIPEHFS
jgi:hypothetical protein